ncbi:MAG: ZIP family metal transporter [Oscillospiraceae bacterium]|nr:ZIP family metal transporter [Oscillospiraceae bacterium]
MLGTVIAVTVIAAVGGTGLGGLLGVVLKRESEKIVSLLLSFAAGVMIAICFFDLLPEAMDGASVRVVVAGALAGYLVVQGLNYLIDRHANPEVPHIDKAHPKTADDLGELIHANHLEVHKQQGSRRELFVAGIVMACAIALHNIPEGMVIGASYAAGGTAASSLAMATVIGLHNVPEGMAVSVPLVSGGMSRSSAVLLTALTGAPTVIGAVAGYYLGTMSPVMLALALSFAGGAMLNVSFSELLPESILMWRSKLPAFAVMVGIFVGMAIVFA